MSIIRPGAIFGNQQGFVYPTNLKVKGVSLHDNAQIGISATGRVRLENVLGKNNGLLAGAAKRLVAMQLTWAWA
jgi:hypothetical protein